jgi:hypothetical protein
MLNQPDQPPRLRTILFAGAATVILVIAIFSLGTIVQAVGAAVMFIPTQLGIIRQVTPTELITMDMAQPAAPITLPRPGTYAVYANALQLLANQPDDTTNPGRPWLMLQALPNKRFIPLAGVERGLRFYDPIIVPGRPLLTFTVDTPGQYILTYPLRHASFTVIPDYLTDQEQTIAITAGIQISIVVAMLGVFATRRYRRYRVRQQQREAAKQQRFAKGEAFWQSEIQRSQQARQQTD